MFEKLVWLFTEVSHFWWRFNFRYFFPSSGYFDERSHVSIQYSLSVYTCTLYWLKHIHCVISMNYILYHWKYPICFKRFSWTAFKSCMCDRLYCFARISCSEFKISYFLMLVNCWNPFSLFYITTWSQPCVPHFLSRTCRGDQTKIPVRRQKPLNWDRPYSKSDLTLSGPSIPGTVF